MDELWIARATRALDVPHTTTNAMAPAAPDRPVSLAGMQIDVVVHGARDLVAKDRSIGLRGMKKSSDPYVKIYFGNVLVGKTRTIEKNLNPKWAQTISFLLGADDATRIVKKDKRMPTEFVLKIYDEDKITADDFMGLVRVPFDPNKPPGEGKWYDVEKGGPVKLTGAVDVTVNVSTKRMPDLVKGNSLTLESTGGQSPTLRVGLGWEMKHGKAVDLDASCVAVDTNGNVLFDESVYFGNLSNPNGSIRHSGDEREGDEDLDGTGEDEAIVCRLDSVPSNILALYFLVTVAPPGRSLSAVKSAAMRVTDLGTGMGVCSFPSVGGDNPALFMARIARSGSKWVISTISEAGGAARDFGSLIPEIKGFTRDLVPDIVIDPKERIAVMSKGMTIRVGDYSRGAQQVSLGLAWDVTNEVNIDLDSSAICLNKSLEVVETISFKKLRSDNGAIVHSGDEKEGDEAGDDEQISISLNMVDESVDYIGFVINSFSGQELDDVARASCHLFDPQTGRDMARYALSDCAHLDKHTALMMAILYRDETTRSWFLRIASEAAQGRVARDLVDEMQGFLRRCPPEPPVIPPEPEIVMNEMPAPVPVDEEIELDGLAPVYQLSK